MFDFSCALSQSHVIDIHSDCFIAFFASVVVGHSNFFGISLSPHSKGGERRKTLIQAGHVPPKKWEVKKKKTGGRRNQAAFLSFLNSLWKGNICPRIYHILVVS